MATNDGVDSVVVPPKFLPELRRLPDSVLSFPKAIEDVRTLGDAKERPTLTHHSSCTLNTPS
jgi:hypothetical protein